MQGTGLSCARTQARLRVRCDRDHPPAQDGPDHPGMPSVGRSLGSCPGAGAVWLVTLRLLLQPRPAAPLRMGTSPCTAPRATSATSSTRATRPRASPTGASASSSGETQVSGLPPPALSSCMLVLAGQSQKGRDRDTRTLCASGIVSAEQVLTCMCCHYAAQELEIFLLHPSIRNLSFKFQFCLLTLLSASKTLLPLFC